MANPFFTNRPGGYIPGQQPSGPFGNLQNMLAQFMQFKNNFKGDPKQKVQEMLNSGQMTQEQFNQLSAMANNLHGLFGK